MSILRQTRTETLAVVQKFAEFASEKDGRLPVAEQSEEEKQYWKVATERRKANAMRLGRLCVYVEKEQVDGFNELYQTWIERWGKSQATDAVIAAIAEYEAKYQDLRELVLKRKREAKRGRNRKG